MAKWSLVTSLAKVSISQIPRLTQIGYLTLTHFKGVI